MEPRPSIIMKPPVLESTGVKFFDEGELVGFTIGNSTLRMTYADAFRFAQLLRLHAKRAKRKSGDVGQHWSAMGILEGIKEGG